MSYMFPPGISSLILCRFLLKQVSGQFKHLMIAVHHCVDAFWLPTDLNMLKEVLSQCLIIKDHRDVLVDSAKGSAITAFNLFVAQRCVL